MNNMTTTEKDQLGIVGLSAAPAATNAEPPADEDWTLIFVALAFMVVIGIVGFFVYRKVSREMKDRKQNSKQSMDDFKQSLMSQYAMDYGDVSAPGASSAEMLPTAATYANPLVNSNSSTSKQPTQQQEQKSSKKNNSNKSSQKLKKQKKEYQYDDEGNAFYYDENGDAWYAEEGDAEVSAQEQEEL